MTISLKADVEDRLVMRIADGLQTTTPSHGFLTASDLPWAEKLIEDLPEDARTKIERFLGEHGLATFISAEIYARSLSVEGRSPIQGGVSLTENAFLSNALNVARSLVDKIKKLPIRYQVTVALPANFSEPLDFGVPDRFDLPSNVCILRGGSLPVSLPLESKIAKVDSGLFTDPFGDEDNQPREIDMSRFYFTMPVLGYATHMASSTLGRSFEDYIRAFYGASMAVGLLEYGWAQDGLKLPYMMIHGPDGEIVETEKLEDDLREREYKFSTEEFVKASGSKVGAKLSEALTGVGTIFANNVDCRRLFTACIWYYRAKMNRRPLDALLEATIAIEVMLGDRKAAEGVGLSNLLGSRCFSSG